MLVEIEASLNHMYYVIEEGSSRGCGHFSEDFKFEIPSDLFPIPPRYMTQVEKMSNEPAHRAGKRYSQTVRDN